MFFRLIETERILPKCLNQPDDTDDDDDDEVDLSLEQIGKPKNKSIKFRV